MAEPVRAKILDICKNNLTDDGVALVSYNVYPGWHFRSMIRDITTEIVVPQSALCSYATQHRVRYLLVC